MRILSELYIIFIWIKRGSNVVFVSGFCVDHYALLRYFV